MEARASAGIIMDFEKNNQKRNLYEKWHQYSEMADALQTIIIEKFVSSKKYNPLWER
jgi:hypothetical protein